MNLATTSQKQTTERKFQNDLTQRETKGTRASQFSSTYYTHRYRHKYV